MDSTLKIVLADKFKDLKIDKDTQKSLITILKAKHRNVVKKYLNKTMVSKNLTSILLKLKEKNAKDIEENIRKQKLRAAIQAKKELEDKLMFVSQSIGNLQDKPKRSQQEIYEDEKKKAELFAQQIKKFSQSRKETESFLKAQTEKVKRKAKILEESDLQLAEKMKELREFTRQQELEKMKAKREKRDQELEKIKLSQTISPIMPEKKPLYLKIEENFKSRVEMPELEKRKNELKKKSEFFRSYQGESLKDHLRWYSSIKEQSMKKIREEVRNKLNDSQNRSISVNQGYWAMKVIEEEQRRQEEEMAKVEEKKKLLERKVKYCELLKELHPPNINPLKNSFSTDKSREKQEKQHKRISESASVEPKKWKPHKFEPNHMVPPPKPMREPKQVTYLEEKRKEKQERSQSPETALKLKQKLKNDIEQVGADTSELNKVHKTAQKLEEIARKKEILMETKPLSLSGIQQAASVDSLLVSSIKAKLHVLENL